MLLDCGWLAPSICSICKKKIKVKFSFGFNSCKNFFQIKSIFNPSTRCFALQVKPGDIECGCSSVGTEAAIAIGAMMSSRLQHQITDMDEHLSDIQAHPDWTNQALNQLISQT